MSTATKQAGGEINSSRSPESARLSEISLLSKGSGTYVIQSVEMQLNEIEFGVPSKALEALRDFPSHFRED